MTTLFDPLRVGELLLPNRILMAPLTRSRAGVVRVPKRFALGAALAEAKADMFYTGGASGYADYPGLASPGEARPA